MCYYVLLRVLLPRATACVLLTMCYWPCASAMCYYRVLLACATALCY